MKFLTGYFGGTIVRDELNYRNGPCTYIYHHESLLTNLTNCQGAPAVSLTQRSISKDKKVIHQEVYLL